MTVSGVFRTVSGGAQQFVGATFAPNALPPAYSEDPFAAFPTTTGPQFNDNNYDAGFRDNGYNEHQSFLPNGNGRNR